MTGTMREARLVLIVVSFAIMAWFGLPGSPQWMDVAARLSCLAVIGIATFDYYRTAKPKPDRKPWLSDWQADRIGKAIELTSVAVLLIVLLALVVLLVLWWLT
jgi:hypothetical protein